MSDDRKVVFVNFKKEKKRRKSIQRRLFDKSFGDRLADWIILMVLMFALTSLAGITVLAILISASAAQ